MVVALKTKLAASKAGLLHVKVSTIKEDLLKPATPRHDAKVLGFGLGSGPFCYNTLIAKPEDYNTVPKHLERVICFSMFTRG